MRLTLGGQDMYYTKLNQTPFPITLVGDDQGIVRLYIDVPESKVTFEIQDHWIENASIFDEAICQLQAYFQGERKSFDLKLNPQGTPYQKKVWQALQDIPFGEVATYKEIAIVTGNDKASRAVGMANGKNPIPIIIPCHRVIGSNGKLTGFAFGLGVKSQLLSLEGTDR